MNEETVVEVYKGMDKDNPCQLIKLGDGKAMITIGKTIVAKMETMTEEVEEEVKKQINDADNFPWKLIQGQIIDIILAMKKEE